MAPSPSPTASCIRRPRSSTTAVASTSAIDSAATSAAYSPRLWPAMATGICAPREVYTRQTAISAASMAGWVQRVWLSSSAGPSLASAHRSRPIARDASSNVARTTSLLAARSASMPMLCDPWPGKMAAVSVMNALSRSAAGGYCCWLLLFVSAGRPKPMQSKHWSVFYQGRAPCEPAAESFEQHGVAALDSTRADGHVQRHGHRGRRGVAVNVDGHDDAIHRHIQLARGRLDDPEIGLVRNQPVEVVFFHVVVRQRLVDDPAQRVDRNLEHLVALHAYGQPAARLGPEAPGYADIDAEQVGMVAIGMNVSGQNTRLGIGLQYRRARAVAEQHAGRAVVPVDHPREGFGTHHENTPGIAGLDVLGGDRKCVDEAGTGGIDIEGAAFTQAETLLYQACSGRKDDIRGGGADDQEVDIRGLDAGVFERDARCLLGQVAGGLAFGCNPPLADAGAIANPFVGSLYQRFEIGVGHYLLRQVTAGTYDACIHP